MGIVEIQQEILDKAEKDNKGPPCYMIIEWNRSTKEMFRRGKKPLAGRKYCFRCCRSDGKRMYFELCEI